MCWFFLDLPSANCTPPSRYTHIYVSLSLDNFIYITLFFPTIMILSCPVQCTGTPIFMSHRILLFIKWKHGVFNLLLARSNAQVLPYLGLAVSTYFSKHSIFITLFFQPNVLIISCSLKCTVTLTLSASQYILFVSHVSFACSLKCTPYLCTIIFVN